MIKYYDCDEISLHTDERITDAQIREIEQKLEPMKGHSVKSIHDKIEADAKKNIDPNKVKNVHFVKGSIFDRDYFRRLYPNINVRNNPANADVIIYDNKSINNINKKSVYLVELDQNFYIKSNRIIFDISDCMYNRNTYQNRSYGAKIRNRIDKDNSKLLSEICQKIQTYKNVFGIQENYTVRSVVFREVSDYSEELINSQAIMVQAPAFLERIDSNERQNNLDYNEYLAILAQIINTDENISKAGLDSILCFSDKFICSKYIAVSLYYLTHNIKKAHSKLQVFLHTCSSKNLSIPNSNSSILSNIIMLTELFISRINDFHNKFPDHLNNDDKNIIQRLLTSGDLIPLLNSVGLGSNYLSINNLEMKIKSPWANQQKNVTQTTSVKAADIDEFTV